MKKFLILIGICCFALACTSQPTHHKTDRKYATSIVKSILKTQGPITTKRLRGGLSGAKIFLIEANQQKFVLRFLRATGAQRDCEIACLQTASDEGYGPHLYAADPLRGYVLMEYVEPHLITFEDRRSENFYRALGKIVSKMHRGPQFPRAETIFEYTSADIKKLHKYKSFESSARQMETLFFLIQKALPEVTTKTPSHNDLNPNNLIFSGSSFKIIDYEAATQDDPYFDLATVIIFYCLDSRHEEALLDAYFERPANVKEKAKLFIMKQAVYVCYAARYLNILHGQFFDWNAPVETYPEFVKKIQGREASLEKKETIFQFGRVFLQEAQNNCQSKDFEEAQKLLAT